MVKNKIILPALYRQFTHKLYKMLSTFFGNQLKIQINSVNIILKSCCNHLINQVLSLEV